MTVAQPVAEPTAVAACGLQFTSRAGGGSALVVRRHRVHLWLHIFSLMPMRTFCRKCRKVFAAFGFSIQRRSVH